MQLGSQPHNGEIRLVCRACGNRWDEQLRLPMQMEAFIARLTGFKVCPVCGDTHNVFLRTEQDGKEVAGG